MILLESGVGRADNRAMGGAVADYAKNGFCVFRLLDERSVEHLIDRCAGHIRFVAESLFPGRAFDPVPLSRYHDDRSLSEAEHRRLFATDHRRVPIRAAERALFVNDVVLAVLEYEWGHRAYSIRQDIAGEWPEGYFGFHVVRPNRRDTGGVHAESGYGLHPISLWIPLIGFTSDYTLSVAPGSHRAPHPDEEMENGGRFKARPFRRSYFERFEFVRPQLRPGEAMIFSPELLHGASYNHGKTSRVSLEVRFFEADSALPAVEIPRAMT